MEMRRSYKAFCFSLFSTQMTLKTVSEAKDKNKKTYILLDIDVSRTCTTDADTDVIAGEVLFRKLAHSLIEGGREQHIAVVAVLIGVLGKLVVVEPDEAGKTYHRQP